MLIRELLMCVSKNKDSFVVSLLMPFAYFSIVFTDLYFFKDINPLRLYYICGKYLIPAFCLLINFVGDLSELFLFLHNQIHQSSTS